MPFPGDLTTITVTASYPNIAGQPQSGLVKFDPQQPIADSTGDVILTGAVVQKVYNGVMQPVILPCTDNLTSPTNFQYKITETFGTQTRSYYVYLPHSLGSTVDLSSLSPVEPVTAMAAYMPLAGGQFTGAVEPAVASLTDAAMITVAAAAGNILTVTLGGNRTLATPTGGADGQVIRFRITQDGSGSRTLSFASGYEFTTSLPAPVLSTSPGATDVLLFEYNAAKSKWVLLAYLLGE